METDVETPAPASPPDVAVAVAVGADPPAREPVPPAWVRPRWGLRLFVISLLLAAAATVVVAAVTIVRDVGGAHRRQAVNGVLMPSDAHFRDITGQLLARRTPERLSGLTIVGAGGQVTVIRYQPGRPSFPSNYLNPNALSVIARAVGAASNRTTTVEELRLEVLRSTGRQRWRLRGTQGGAPWRATIAPNGTDLRLIATNKS